MTMGCIRLNLFDEPDALCVCMSLTTEICASQFAGRNE